MMTYRSEGKIRVLFLAASPTNRLQVNWAPEFHSIQREIDGTKYRELFDLIPRFATKPEDFCDDLIKYEPDIVHFCGHGDEEGIVLEDEYGLSSPIDSQKLANIFSCSEHKIRLIFLNTCYSETQAKVLQKKTEFTIGTKTAISDEAAIKLASRFYRYLGNGTSIQGAFKAATLELNRTHHLASIVKITTNKTEKTPTRFVQPYLEGLKKQSSENCDDENKESKVFQKHAGNDKETKAEKRRVADNERKAIAKKNNKRVEEIRKYYRTGR